MADEQVILESMTVFIKEPEPNLCHYRNVTNFRIDDDGDLNVRYFIEGRVLGCIHVAGSWRRVEFVFPLEGDPEESDNDEPRD